MQALLLNTLLGKWFTGKTDTPCQRYHLSARQQLQLKLRTGNRLTCLRGSLWVTLGNEDRVLTAGQSLSLPKKTPIFIEALEFSAAAVADS